MPNIDKLPERERWKSFLIVFLVMVFVLAGFVMAIPLIDYDTIC